ncbi:MAG: efflux RND transporter periplasmic adaptor subunit, partial [Gemmatimonadales bacterium]|nr:efflux RND transporter periplasmic adaptor subunit [Gemmatimonadales bacterium]
MSRTTVPSLATVAAAIFLGACGNGQEAAEPLVRPVRYEQVFAGGGSRIRSFAGVARAGIESRLSFRVAGAVQQVPVEVGDSVEVGQLLAEIDPQDYRIRLQQAQAALQQARAQARNAQANYERVRALYENNNATPTDLDAARSASESAQALVDSYRNQVQLARLQLGYTRLSAPMAGAIAEVNVEVNENVATGKQVVLLTSGTIPEVEVAIPEVLITRVRQGAPVMVMFDAIPTDTFPGRVTEVGVSSTDMATTFPVRVQLERADSTIRSGMAAEVAFSFEATGRAGIEVPPVAVGEDATGRFVLIVEPDDSGYGTVHRRDVSVGELTTT